MDDQKFSEIDDLLGLTDTEASSSSSSDHGQVYKNRQSFVLELHELKKDVPNPTNNVPVAKSKRHKKKKQRPESKKSNVSGSSDSISQSSSAESTPAEDHTREKFYDAHESYHDLPETQLVGPVMGPVAGAVIAQAISQQGFDPKQMRLSSSSSDAPGNRTQPSPIAKPSRPSE